jgi:rhodanese-related sulfurtransferase
LIYKKKDLKGFSDDKLFGNQKTELKDSSKIDDMSITYEQMLKIIENPDFIIVDARNPVDFAKSKIGNAVNIFPYLEESEVIPKILDLPQNKKIVVYCDGGTCDASHKVVEIMKNFGYNNVYLYQAGWEEWSKKKGIK